MNRIKVSDHAVLRYLERGCGVDIGAIRAHIARQTIGQMGAYFSRTAGAEFRVISDGLKFLFKVEVEGEAPTLTTVVGTQDLQSKRAMRIRLRRKRK